MSAFGNGSNGALNVTSGTHYLPLNVKHQFTTVNVAAGALLTTNSNTGAVLYICATESITINGSINLLGRMLAGNNSWSVTIDGITYSSPGVAAGGWGLGYSQNAPQGNGFGGGGGGGATPTAGGGNGGTGAAIPGGGGAGHSASVTTNNSYAITGGNGGASAGGGGGVRADFARTSGTVTGVTVAYKSGSGGNAYGQSGSDGSNPAGTSYATGGSGSWEYEYTSLGGGGAGGIAGSAGVHVVLVAPVITINGSIVTSGTGGGNGGNGGRSYSNNTYFAAANAPGGGGGGGGNGGSVYVRYATSYVNLGSTNRAGGAGGSGGWKVDSSYQSGNGTNGSAGALSIQQLPPEARFTQSTTTPYNSQAMTFTDQSVGNPTSWLWNFGDTTTSTSQNPTKTYTTNGTYTVTLTATSALGSNTITKTNVITVSTIVYELDIVSTNAPFSGKSTLKAEAASYGLVISQNPIASGRVSVRSSFQALASKDYEYRVFDEDWNYLSTWVDVTSKFTYTQKINENASSLNVTIGRHPDNRVVRYESLLDEDSEQITDQNEDPIIVPVETPNSVGLGTDVRTNLNVEVYTFYGGYEALLDETGDDILDENGEAILVPFGSPNGRRVYSGYITDYTLSYGSQVGVDVTIVPHHTELSNYIFKSGANTTVKYLNEDPQKMNRDAMDNYKAQGGYVDYTVASIPLSGDDTDYEFKLQTIREVLDKTVALLPGGWYHYLNPADNTVYVREKAEEPHHIFYYQKHIKDLNISETITGLVNEVYFTGGEIDPDNSKEVLFKHYEDTDSQNSIRKGLMRLSDSRVTLDSSSEVLSNREISEGKQSRHRTTLTITDAVYDIEDIEEGQVIGFANFDTFVDNLKLQIVGITHNEHDVVMELDTAMTRETKRLETLRKQIEQEQIRHIADAPL